jgi:hypothetical protein
MRPPAAPRQVINVDTLFAVNHMGRMSVQICSLDAKPGQGKCKNLYLKAPGHTNTKSWYLPNVKGGWGGGNYGGDGPKYGAPRRQASSPCFAGVNLGLEPAAVAVLAGSCMPLLRGRISPRESMHITLAPRNRGAAQPS